MSQPDDAKSAKRLLWGVVIAFLLLNLVLFLVYS